MPRRSRGCEACRRAHRLCDSGFPSCRRCLRAGRKCTGPLLGPIVIDQTQHIISNERARQSQGHSAHNASAPAHFATCLITGQPSHAAFLTAAYLCQFTSFVASMTGIPIAPTWLNQLFNIPQDQRSHALDVALEATATAYCSADAKHPPTFSRACRMYGEALALHSRSLSGSPRSVSGSVARVLTSAVLSVFEAIVCTRKDAYCTHLTTARHMLALAIPELTSKESEPEIDLLWHVYVHVMYQSVSHAAQSQGAQLLSFYFSCTEILTTQISLMITRRSECVTSGSMVDEGRTVVLWEPPNGDQRRPILERLLILMFRIGKTISSDGQGYEKDVQPYLQSIADRVERLLSEYEAEASEAGEQLLLGRCLGKKGDSTLVYRDASTASTMACFAACRILLCLAGYQKTPRTSAAIEEQYQGILDSARFVLSQPESESRTSNASLSMLFPVTLVALYSHSPAHHAAASALLKGCLGGTTFGGLWSKSVETVETSDTDASALFLWPNYKAMQVVQSKV